MRYSVHFLLLSIHWLPLPTFTANFTGNVVGRSDGHTLAVLNEGLAHRCFTDYP